MFWPLLLYVRARACGARRQSRLRDSTSSTSRSRSPAGWGPLPPLFFAMKGDLLLALPEPDAAAARPASSRVTTSRRSSAPRSPQLRAALGLCRVESERGTELLRATYETFTEGFATPDLIEAKEVLAEQDA